MTDSRVAGTRAPAVDGRGAAGPVLQTEGLTVRFGGLTALNGVSMTVRRGEIRAIIGPNGAGKSTFFNCLTGVIRPTGGRILLDGNGAEGWLAHDYVAGRSLGTVLAKGREEGLPFALDNALQVGRQVGIALERTHAHKGADGAPLVHGLLTPWSVVVSYEGAVQLPGCASEERGCLPGEHRDPAEAISRDEPEVAAQQAGDRPRSLSGIPAGAQDCNHGVAEIDAVEQNRAAADTAAVAGKTHRRQSYGRFAGAGFADQTQHFATA